MTAPGASELGLRPRSGPEIVDAALALLRGRYVALAAVAGALFLPYLLLEALFFGGPEPGSLRLLDLIAWTATCGVADGALTLALAEAYHGRPVDGGAAIRGALRRAPSVVGAMLVKWALVASGAMFLLVPGLIVYTRLLAVPTVVVLEGRGPRSALQRSWDMTVGAGARVAGIAVLLLAFYVVVNAVVGAAGGLAMNALGPDTPAIGVRMLGTLSTVLLAPAAAAVTTVLYYDLRIRREGYDVELLAAETALTA